MLDRLASRVAARPAISLPAKAETGIGAFYMTHDPPLASLARTPQKMMREAQAIGVRNRWIRRAEKTISDRFGSVGWHLETRDGEVVTDDSPPALRAVRDLLEKPYTPKKGDPLTPTPRTRSGLWGITSRHKGLCGSSFWFLDEVDALNGFPLQLLYVNPARMTPAAEGGNLYGWVLDADDRGNGIPLRRDQVLHFTLDEPDDGYFPAGLVETAMADVNITAAADRHTAGTMASGGKLTGVYSPRGDTVIPPDVFQTLERELRAQAELPDAMRRSIVLRGPVEFTPTSANAQELDLVAVQGMARDDVFIIWNMPLSQVGGTAPVGLNSEGNKDSDEAILWQNAVKPRLDRFREKVQFELLDRLPELGLQLVIEEPEFDDDAPKYSMATQAANLPLRNVERRAILGLPPFGDEALDNAVVLPATMVTVASAPPVDVPTATGKKPPINKQQADAVGALIRSGFSPAGALEALGLPPIEHLGLLPITVQTDPANAEVAADALSGKASTKALHAKPVNVRPAVDNMIPKIQRDLEAFLKRQRSEVLSKIKSNADHIARKPGDASSWWDDEKWDRELMDVLRPYAAGIAEITVEQTDKVLGEGS